MGTKSIYVNKTVTRNFIMDFVASVQNTFGLNLTSYQKMVEKGIKQIEEELQDKKLKWYRYEIAPLHRGALSITLYGELE